MNSPQAIEKIYPSKIRFFFAYFIWLCSILLPFILVLSLISQKRPDYSGLWYVLPIFLIGPIISYPYYTLSIDHEKISGGTLWGWLWRIEEIKLSEISREKTASQTLGKLIGITVIYSMQGKKILTLGLNDSQISKILESSKDDNKSSKSH
jgi:hypothetical protein